MNKEKQKIVPVLRFPEFEHSEDWVIDKFSSFIKLYRGSSPRPINQFLTKEENGVNWIKIGDTKNATNFKISEVGEKITLEGSKKSRKVIKGELILANSMSYGATYELEIDGCIYDGWFVLREYEDSFDKQFLLQLLNSNFLQTQYKRLAAGGIVQNISSVIVYNTLLPKISKVEQQKIASCLSSLDNLITAETDKLDNLKDHKRGLLQQLFPAEGETQPQCRFPEFENDGEWDEKKLGQISRITTGSSNREDSTEEEGEYAFFDRSEDIRTSSRYLFDCEAIIVAGEGQKFTPKYFIGKFDLHQRAYAVMDFDGNSIGKYLFYYIFNNNDYFLRYAVGSTVKSLRQPIFENMPVLIPSNPKEQQKIANCLSSVDDLIEEQAQKTDTLKAHKKGLMQQLFPKINDVAI
ncbi:restriction endonuclease subunit S [Oceanihabitans sp.]|nr:restriction endonuclease subunit S [Oceanihabitans sp.]